MSTQSISRILTSSALGSSRTGFSTGFAETFISLT
ncbi:uncharacterized protein METZ01_LOCUS377166 [marine metagenome]|uniref:Uncharacterized protein n=1 Tax=marine metagenome TaxID=408172 RepID=A0A382TRF5_9ZZZZ